MGANSTTSMIYVKDGNLHTNIAGNEEIKKAEDFVIEMLCNYLPEEWRSFMIVELILKGSVERLREYSVVISSR